MFKYEKSAPWVQEGYSIDIGIKLNVRNTFEGSDNISSEDYVESKINEPGKERYWDEPEGKEE